MFKNFETYVSPILLSYVDKYIKDFKSDDLQVSLWSGSVSLNNLELRPDIIQRELGLPFSLSSGHIHELIIQVPWMKIAYEPIVITINTIECVLKLTNGETTPPTSSPHINKNKEELDASPGYVQSLVNRIVNNIAFRCNNVILKYVEEDIVVSVNIKQFYLDNVDGNWMPKFTEITAEDLHIRKLINLSDLTLCLDKRNAAGKIETYLEPLLYKCEVEFKLDSEYSGMLNKKPKYTRIYINSPRLEFNFSYQQIPMILRIASLFVALKRHQLAKVERPDAFGDTKHAISKSLNPLSYDPSNMQVSSDYDDSWSGWIWSFVDPFPLGNNEEENDTSINTNPVLLSSINFEVVKFSFKIPDLTVDSNVAYSSNQRKIRYTNIFSLELKTVLCETSSHGLNRFCFRGGVHSIKFYPEHVCPCGIPDIENNNSHKNVYFESTTNSESTAVWPVEYDDSTIVDSMKDDEMLAVCPAFAMSYNYYLVIPDEKKDHFQIGTDLEYSNFKEDVNIGVAFGPCNAFLCSGLVHRLSLVKIAAEAYDYAPYYTPKPLTRRQDLPPPTTDDYDALTAHIPKINMKITVLKPCIYISIWDHYSPIKPQSNFDGTGMSSIHRRKISSATSDQSILYYEKLKNIPLILIECRKINLSIFKPMYPNRITYVTCQLPDPPAIMIDACYKLCSLEAKSFTAFLICMSKKKQKENVPSSIPMQNNEGFSTNEAITPIITECNVQMSSKSLILEEYWTNNKSMHINDYNFNMENITLCVTMAKLLTLHYIVAGLFPPSSETLAFAKTDKPGCFCAKEHIVLLKTSLLEDTFEDKDTVHLDINLEGLSNRIVYLSNTYTHRIVLNSVKIFAIDFSKESSQNSDVKQVWVVSAPEMSNKLNSRFFKGVFQNSTNDLYATFLTIKLEEWSFVMDPLLCHWLTYKFKKISSNPVVVTENAGSSGIVSNVLHKRLSRRSLDEIVNRIGGSSRTLNRLSLGQSSSDREKDFVHGSLQISPQPNVDDDKDKTSIPHATLQNPNKESFLYNMILSYFKNDSIALFVEVGNISLYLPKISISAVNHNSVRAAMNSAILNSLDKNSENILIIRLPSILLKNSCLKHNLLPFCIYGLPVKLPIDAWDKGKKSYPWTVQMKDFSINSLSHQEINCEYDIAQTNILKSVSSDITISFNPKTGAQTKNVASLKPHCDSKDIKSQQFKNESDLNINTDVHKSPQNRPELAESTSQYNKENDDTSVKLLTSLGICIHVDTELVIISLNHNQMNLLSVLSHGLNELFNILLNSKEKKKSSNNETQTNLCQNTATLNRIRYSSNSNDIAVDNFQEENFSRNSDIQGSDDEKSSNLEQDIPQNDENFVVTTWLQWTISRIVFKMYIFDWSNKNNHCQHLKLVFAADDVVSSLDKQYEYLKWKTKVVTAGINYYKRNHPSDSWIPGSYCGIIMRGKENIKRTKSHTENCFLFINITKARSASVHSKWKDMCKITPKTQNAKNDYISEIEISLQALDLIINLDALKPFIFLISPFINPITCNIQSVINEQSEQISENMDTCTMAKKWNCHSLPLCYFEGSVIRIIMPTEANSILQDNIDNALVIQVNKISLTSTAENPVCRNPLRPDLYQEAARKGYLIIPGSELEDRQCQLLVKGISINSTHHSFLEKSFGLEVHPQPSVSENPALRWNDSSVKPNTPLPLMNIIEKIDLCFVLALATFYRSELICGPTIDLSILSDIEISMSTSQLQLIKCLINDFSSLMNSFNSSEISSKRTTKSGIECGQKINQINCPYDTYIHERALIKNTSYEYFMETMTPALSSDTGIASDVMSSITNNSKNTPSSAKSHSSLKHSDKVSHADYFDVYVTFGKVCFNLYERLINSNESSNKDESLVKEGDFQFTTKAFIYITLLQPNFTFSKYHYTSKSQFSVFHASVSLGDDFTHIGVPKPNDFLLALFETKVGVPDSINDISPNFLTLKWEKCVSKKISMNIQIKCPIRITASLDRLQKLKKLNELISHDANLNSNDSNSNLSENFSPKSRLKLLLDYYETIDVFISQTVFAINAQNNIDYELLISYSSLKYVLSFSTRPEKILNYGLVDSLTVTLRKTDDRRSKILINPWTIGFEVNLLWDSWQSSDSSSILPIYHILLQTDKLLIEISIDHINILNGLLAYWHENENAVTEILFNKESPKPVSEEVYEIPDIATCSSFWNKIGSNDQHYKDDLRAGAFKFIHGGIGNPLPYQVFIDQRGLTWRYPQARAITCIHSFPVPFQMLNENEMDTHINDYVLCTLEYFSEINNCFQYFAKFSIKQDQRVKLNQASFDHRTVFSSMWRVMMYSDESEIAELHSDCKQTIFDKNAFLSKFNKKPTNYKTLWPSRKNPFPIKPQALAACLRIDSYYTPHLVPKIQAILNISLIEMNFFNYYRQRPLPPLLVSLQSYEVNGFFPLEHVFCSITLQSFNLQTSFWKKNIAMLKFESDVGCHIVDGSGMVLNKVIEIDDLSICHCISENDNDVTDLTVYTNKFQTDFGPHHLHTLYTSFSIWKDIFTTNIRLMSSIKNMIDDKETCHDCSQDKPEMVIPKYFVCNDTNLNLRFRQYSTDENILLESRKCHLYSWKSYFLDSLLSVTINLGNWKFSKPFQIEKSSVTTLELVQKHSDSRVSIVVLVEVITPVQRCVTFMGGLIFMNTLPRTFHLKIYQKKVLQLHGASGSSVVSLEGNNRAPSLLLKTDADSTIRLHFSESSSGWSGDIPLKECVKGNIPWLVKVPDKCNSQYISIWCRVIKDNVHGRTLVVLSPLYILKSHLPIPMQIEVLSENVTETSEYLVDGKGSIHVLQCPGTTTTNHFISIKLASDEEKPKIPFFYDMIDQSSNFTPKEETPDIYLIINNIKLWFDSQQAGDLEWPYISPEGGMKWKSVDQQFTSDVTIRYLPATRGLDSMIIDVAPWALMGNCSGTKLMLFNLEKKEICVINHQEVLIPPSVIFKESFYCGIFDKDNITISCPINISTTTLGPYEKSKEGCISLESNMCFKIRCLHCVYIFDAFYEIKENINLFKISSKYVLVNQLSSTINVLPFALNPKLENIFTPEMAYEYSTNIEPNKSCNKGTPIDKFYIVTAETLQTDEDLALYLVFNMASEKIYSCPVRIDKFLQRKQISIILDEGKSYPIVLACQEYCGQIFITLLKDETPQFLIKNQADMSIAVAQVLRESIISDMYTFVSKDEILPHSVVQECNQSNWHCIIKPGTECYYTLPTQSLQYPDLFQSTELMSNFVENSYLAFAFIKDTGGEPRAWSIPVDVSTNTLEQFVKLPGYVGDIKVIVESHCYSTLITINNVTQHDISASDIRQRLLSTIPFGTLISEESAECSVENEIKTVVTSENDDISIAENNIVTDHSEIHNKYSSSSILKCININIILNKVNISLNNNNATKDKKKSLEIIYIECERFVLTSTPSPKGAKIVLTIGDMQIDNPLFSGGGYDFQVILVKHFNESSIPVCDWRSSVLSQAEYISNIIDSLRKEVLFQCIIEYEIWNVNQELYSGLNELNIMIAPISIYIEDSYISTLVEYATDFMPTNVPLICLHRQLSQFDDWTDSENVVRLPEYINWESCAVAYPIQLKRIQIEPLNIMLSVHSSKIFYLALDHSPLQFAKFERINILTSSYRLGHALTMHYLSEAIFGAGWVVGSLEILGSPSGLARRVTAGLRDLVREPCLGLLRGPWGFVVGMTHGSVSLLKHVTQGTVESVSMVMGSVARNLDRLSLDQDHMQRTQRARRHRPQGLVPALTRGLQGLGLSFLGAIGGIAHEALIAGYEQRKGPVAVAAGLTRGLVGMITKPLSATADLLALTGQGLLHQAGWDQHPQPRWVLTDRPPIVCKSENFRHKLGNTFVKSSLLYICQGINRDSAAAVTIVLTNMWLILLDTKKDKVIEMNKLEKWSIVKCSPSTGELFLSVKSEADDQNSRTNSTKLETDVQMDPALRARIAAYIGLEEDTYVEDKIYRLMIPFQHSTHCATMILFSQFHSLNHGFPVL